MPVTLVKSKWHSGNLQFRDTTERAISQMAANAVVENITGATKTLDAQDVGKLLFCTVTTVITLPSTVVGYTYTVVNFGAADGDVQISLDPAAADKIMGPDIAGVDNKDLINTLATAVVGDRVTIIGDGSLGWYVVAPVHGTWAAEA